MNPPSRPESDSTFTPRQPGPLNDFVRFPIEDVEQSIPARFEKQVRAHGGRLAVKTRRDQRTYDSLNRFANRVARAILKERTEAEETVALLFEQGVPLVAAILGALKAGKIYVPLDPAWPGKRIEYLLDDSRAALIVTDAGNLASSRRWETTGRRVLSIERMDEGPSEEDVGLEVLPGRLACLFYTSGSTGRPKGVVDSHRNVLHNILRYTNGLHIASDDRLSLLQGASFSGAVSSLFGALLNGAAVFPFDLRQEGLDRLASWMMEERITIYHSVPSIFRLLAETPSEFPHLRLIRLEGDRASWRDFELFRERFGAGCILVNGLGATETGISRQFFMDRDTPISGSVLPVGWATEGVECAVLDVSDSDVGPGEVGEICVRSEHLAVGYWNRPDLTRAAFRPDPAKEGSRIYRSGDVGRMREDGCLEYLGRKDLHPKVRGRRVEVEAIEAALLATDGIREAVVAVRAEEGGDPRTVAYIVPSGEASPTAGELRRALARTIPEHSLPSVYVRLGALPLDENGKVDRRSLPAPGRDRPVDSGFERPRSPAEELVARMWEEVLGVSRVGAYDDFFDLGGDSLKALQLVNRLRSALAVEVPLRLVFEQPTVAGMASAMAPALDASQTAARRIAGPGG